MADEQSGTPRKGLLMDWGGVMVGGLFESFAAFCSAEGIEPQAVRHAFRDSDEGRRLLVEFECGRMPEPEFERGLAAELGLRGDPAGLVGRLFAGMRPEEALLEAVVAFRRAGVRTGLLSNSWGESSYPVDRLGELFDVLVISGELGVRKPDQAIYDLAVERMGLAPEELVFVDDLPGNLKPARAMGIATIHHQDAAATVAQLEELLGVAVSGTSG